MGVAVLGSVVSLIYRDRLTLPAGLDPAARAAVTDSLAAGTNALDPASPVLDGARASFTVAMQTTSLIAAAVTLAAAIVAWRTIPATAGTVAEDAPSRPVTHRGGARRG